MSTQMEDAHKAVAAVDTACEELRTRGDAFRALLATAAPELVAAHEAMHDAMAAYTQACDNANL